VPEKGGANAAIEQVIAKALGLPKSAVSVEKGETAASRPCESPRPVYRAAIEALLDVR
jgi:hypothetical protein